VTQLLEDNVKQVEERLRATGETPYYIPNGCKAIHGALGYSGCVLEILTQLRELHLVPNFIVTACGSSSTQLGLILGTALYTQGEAKVLGMSVSRHKDELREKIKQNLGEVTGFLDLKQDVTSESITVYDDYVGEGYGIPSAVMKKAVRLVARKEGIILDPVYTGKAMAGLIDLIRKGQFEKDDVIVFLHTGGVAGLFAEGQMETFQE
jgi:1-aminocyclopropane-1-carboxylate deaminase/D-cysteine desulfhydrase-like pyridoxal-dependent ACC family enzyme